MNSLHPRFQLLPPARRGHRFQLVVTNPPVDGGAAPLVALTFRVSSPDQQRLVGTLAHRGVNLDVGKSLVVEIGPADANAGELRVIVSDIAWSSYDSVSEAEPVELAAPNAPMESRLPQAAEQAAPVLPSPGAAGALEAWIRWLQSNSDIYGSKPLVMISFASADHHWADHMKRQLEVGLQRRTDLAGFVGSVWSYGNEMRPGDHIHHTIIRAMCEARAAVVFLSPHYFSSPYCHGFELPFLLWRMVIHDLDVRFVRTTHMPDPAPYIVPGKNGARVTVDLAALADDRVATPLGNAARLSTIEDLIQQPAEIDRRFARISQDIVNRVLG